MPETPTAPNPKRTASRAPAWVRLLGVAGLIFFAWIVVRFWHPVYGFTAFYQLDSVQEKREISLFHKLDLYVYPDPGGYDGLYYAQIAQDPTLRNPEFQRAIDNPTYRSRRILPAALAWVLGGGQPAAIAQAYALINVLAWLALAWILWRLPAVNDVRGVIAWGGLLFAAGTMSSVRLALTDLPALTLMAGALLAAECWHGRWAVAILSLGGLSRETALLGVAGLCKAPWLSLKNVARVLLVAVPFVIWVQYVKYRTGPVDQGWSNLTWPYADFVDKWGEALHALATIDRTTAIANLLTLIAITAQAVFILLYRPYKERFWRIGLAFVVLMATLGTPVWEGYPGAAARVLLPLNFAFNLVAHRLRAPIAWLIVGNLTVLAGWLTVRDIPFPRYEMNLFRQGEVIGSVTAGEGWSARESRKGRDWFWSDARSKLVVETWPKREGAVTLHFKLRALAPCTVMVKQAGRELARFEVGLEPTELHTLADIKVPAGRTELEFSTDTPPVKESDAPGARSLAFALYDPQVEAKGW